MRMVFLWLLLMPVVCRGDELPPTLQLPTREVVTKAEATTATVTRNEIVDTIKPGVWYVVRSKVKLIVMDFPAGSVSIISGASGADGLFADGEGKPESRTFPADEFTYLVQGTKPVKCELAFVPVGVKERADIWRQTLTVSDAGPQPPPVDPPTPNPEPLEPPKPPDEKPVVKSFRVIFVKESGQTLPVAQSSVPDAQVIREYLNAKATPENGQPGWRKWDPDQIIDNEQPTMVALWEVVKPKLLPAPCIVVEKNGHATVMPFPANVDECMKLLKEYGG